MKAPSIRTRVLVYFMVVNIVLAQTSVSLAETSGKPNLGFSSGDNLKGGRGGTEFVSGVYPGAVMMKVNLWGGVKQPGVYHVPVGTDLVTLVSYAGGPTQAAQLDNTHIKRVDETQNEKTIKINVEDLILKDSGKLLNPELRVNDIVVIPEDKPFVSQNMILILSVVATVASIVVAGTVIAK